MIRGTSHVLFWPGYSVAAGGAAELSAAGGASIYYDADIAELMFSEAGGAYVPLASTLSGGWTDEGGLVRLTTPSDQVAVGVPFPLVPFDQKMVLTYTPTSGAGSVLFVEHIGEAFGGIQGSSGVRVSRTRTAASADAWFAGFAYEPAGFAGDIGVEIGYHCKPRSDALPFADTGIGFQIEATPGGSTYALAMQAYEQHLRIRAHRDSAGAGHPIEVIGSVGVGGGNVGGDVLLATQPGGAGANHGRVVVRPDNGTQIGPLLAAFADVAAAVPLFGLDADGADAQRQWSRTGEITPAALAADANDYAPVGLATASVLYQENNTGGAGAGISITGLTGGAAGRRLTFVNISALATQTITLTNADAASAAANQFLTAGGVARAIPVNGSVELAYDAAVLKWRVVSQSL